MLVLLDRDGVLNIDRPDSVKSIDELVLLPRAAEALALLTRAGCTNVIITNQSVVGRGLLSEAGLQQIHEVLLQRLGVAGGIIHDIFYCTDMPDAATYRRKPAPGMLKEALMKYNVLAEKTPFVGDALTDLQAAANIGCPRYLVRTGKGERTLQAGVPDVLTPFTLCQDVYDAAQKIVS